MSEVQRFPARMFTPETPCVHASDFDRVTAERDALLREAMKRINVNQNHEFILAIEGALSASAEPSAPVERDERAEFEAWYLGKFCGGQARLFRCVNADQIYYFAEVQSRWDAWQARAALERKP